MFHWIIIFMLYDYLIVDSFGPTAGKQGFYINKDWWPLYSFFFQWVCTHALTAWYTHSDLVMIDFVLPEGMKYYSILEFYVIWYIVAFFSYLNQWQLELVLVSFDHEVVYLFLMQIYHYFIYNLSQ